MKDTVGIIIRGIPPGSEIILRMETDKYPSSPFLCEDYVHVIPELNHSKLCRQRNDESVFKHIMNVLQSLDNRRRICLLAALFHDLGKIETSVLEGDIPRFPGHEFVSSNIARKYMRMWELDNWTIDRVSRIIETHMTDIKYIKTPRAIRNFVARVGEDNLDNWFALRLADTKAYGLPPHVKPMILRFQIIVKKSLKMHQIEEDELAVTRDDLINLANVSTEHLNQIIIRLLESVNSLTVENDFETLINISADMAAR